MAALRSSMAMLGRRSCRSFGSSAVTSMGGRGMEIHQVLRPAPPPLRPAAIRNLESQRRFSTEGGEPRDKADSLPRLVWQWAEYRVKNADPFTKPTALFAYGVVVMWALPIYLMHMAKN